MLPTCLWGSPCKLLPPANNIRGRSPASQLSYLQKPGLLGHNSILSVLRQFDLRMINSPWSSGLLPRALYELHKIMRAKRCLVVHAQYMFYVLFLLGAWCFDILRGTFIYKAVYCIK